MIRSRPIAILTHASASSLPTAGLDSAERDLRSFDVGYCYLGRRQGKLFGILAPLDHLKARPEREGDVRANLTEVPVLSELKGKTLRPPNGLRPLDSQVGRDTIV